MKNGKCKAGSYWCYTDKKCKKIPAGFMVDRAGMLRKENGHTQDEEDNGNHKNGNGSGNGGSNGGSSVSEMYAADRERARRYAEYDAEKKAQYKRNMRMKHGKNWKEFTKDAKDAKDRLRPGEVRTFNKKTGKWESNKD